MQELETKKQIVIIMNDFLKVLQKKKDAKTMNMNRDYYFFFTEDFQEFEHKSTQQDTTNEQVMKDGY